MRRFDSSEFLVSRVFGNLKVEIIPYVGIICLSFLNLLAVAACWKFNNMGT